ncbi:hypothetical protein SAMN05444162_1909 [Paenibacillaceae bacterium GAS479]|nr:hypothetical protein SAMN05444162_1909 [Paenibacillaceae bacterium GAS479]
MTRFVFVRFSLLARLPILALSAAILLSVLLPPAPAAAASLEISPSAQAGFEKTTAKADSATAARLNSSRQNYASQLQGLSAYRQQAQELHSGAVKLAASVRQASGSIDRDAIRNQENRVAKVKSVYEPMYAGYTALNKRIRSAGSKESAKALRMQADTIQAAVQLARQSVRLQQEKLQKLTRERSVKIAAIRKTLSGLEAVSDELRVRKSTARIPESALRDALKDFSSAARKGDAVLMERSLGSMLASSNQLLKQWDAIVELERRYAAIAEQARSQLAGYGVIIG